MIGTSSRPVISWTTRRPRAPISSTSATTGQSSKRRHDEELTNIFRIEVPLPAGFAVSGEYQSSIAQSNVAVFDYTRNVVSLILSWTY